MTDTPKKTMQQMLLELRAAKIEKQVSTSNTAALNTLLTKTDPEHRLRDILQNTKLKLNNAATGMHGESISYNSKQKEFIDLVASGKSCILIGAAGTGKTTCTQGAIQALLNTGRIPILQAEGHKHLQDGTPGIVITAYTRRAVNNSKRAQSEDFKNNCITVHKLLEYSPVKIYITDPFTGEERTSMRFMPSRNQDNAIPNTIRAIIVEEASMLSKEFFSEVCAAIASGVQIQWIFVGDIQQLPPVFGAAILGYKLLELPTVELTEVYRQALESPIIRLAHRILSGKPIPAKEFPEWQVPGKLTIHPWKKRLLAEDALATLAAFFKSAIDKEFYNPDEDTILIPHNVSCGTIELNKHIANHMARRRNASTYEVISGFNTLYFSEGDKVLYDKEDAEILSISYNMEYTGKKPQQSSRTLDYWGYNPNSKAETITVHDDHLDVDRLLEMASAVEERIDNCSHVITLRLLDSDREVSISKSAEVNTLLHAYALTVHKSQGSEWRRVFVALHQSHASMVFRELLYTAVTRAREELYIICEPEQLESGITKQRIKGNTLAEKAEYFKGRSERVL